MRPLLPARPSHPVAPRVARGPLPAGRRPRLAHAAVVGLVLALARSGLADDATALKLRPPELPAPAAASPGLDPRPLRAAAEEAVLLSVWFGVYLLHPSDTAAPSGRYSPTDKLFRGAVSFDANKGFTNFAGHPIAGTAYYLIARGNRLPVWESSLYAAGSATVWELIEFHEKASINDLIVTPVAGIAIGEPAVQLSAFFERRNAGAVDRALAWLFQPVRKIHDRTDGIAEAHGGALPWHRFDAGALAGAVLRGGTWSPALGLALSSRVVHGAGYEEAGQGRVALLDGNDTRLAAEVTLASGGLAEAHLGAHAMLAGLYQRDLSGTGAGDLRGWDLLLDAGTEFNSDFRDWGGPGRTDWTSLVDVPGVELAWRLFLGGARIEARLRAALTFGGVLSFPLAADPGAVPSTELGTVTRTYQYYFALGWALAPALDVRLGPVALTGAARLERFQGLTGHDPAPSLEGTPAPLTDSRSTLSAAARWITPLPGLEVAVTFERAWRDGSVADVRRSATASRALGGAIFAF